MRQTDPVRPGRVERQNLAAQALILIFFVFNVMVMRHVSLTTDEWKHYGYGMKVINFDSSRVVEASGNAEDSDMPANALNALPARIGQQLPEGGFRDFLVHFNTARAVTLVFVCLGAWLVFDWARALYGFVPGMAALFLFAFDPNTVAHSHLVTTDMYLTAAFVFALWSLWKFARRRSLLNGLLLAFAIGLAQLVKLTALALYPLAFACLLVHDMSVLKAAAKKKAREVLGAYARQYAWLLAGLALVSMLVINAGFAFNRPFTPFGKYAFVSAQFQAIQERFPILKNVPVPTPYPYLEGLDLMVQTTSEGMRYGNTYLLGQVHTDGSGFPGYYFVAAFLKVPIAAQILVLAALLVYGFDRSRRARFAADEVFLLLPAAFYTIYYNFFFDTQIGFRYYLCVLALLYIFTGSLFQGWERFSAGRRSLSFALAAYLAISVFSFYPRYISYFNEFVWDRKSAYKYLADSNLDWGQDYDYLQEYRAEYHNVFRAPEVPERIERRRTYFVQANRLVGVTIDPEIYEWLRENFEPTGMITPMYPLFTITPEQMDAFCDRTAYCR